MFIIEYKPKQLCKGLRLFQALPHVAGGHTTNLAISKSDQLSSFFRIKSEYVFIYTQKHHLQNSLRSTNIGTFSSSSTIQIKISIFIFKMSSTANIKLN